MKKHKAFLSFLWLVWLGAPFEFNLTGHATVETGLLHDVGTRATNFGCSAPKSCFIHDTFYGITILRHFKAWDTQAS